MTDQILEEIRGVVQHRVHRFLFRDTENYWFRAVGRNTTPDELIAEEIIEALRDKFNGPKGWQEIEA